MISENPISLYKPTSCLFAWFVSLAISFDPIVLVRVIYTGCFYNELS
ncbi:hypothetical protein VCRA2128O347_90074 [Vibrio crassostreae]|nr:hypothetical protein VCRA2111O320_80081 [Vibrio crassostreae]CAK3211721.1 hypothetical protein VCRA217O315_130072 [Vibrio crassostreae]CAK3663217.1 hypothetical protein VCRA2120O329_90081 [Vibrio crassostreae]CAK4025379.1 hypothetical protein VCRA2128O347_90074 [Vibrio crassostreae]